MDTAIAELDTAFRKLCQRWENTRRVWNDPVQCDFEKNYWTVLAQRMHGTQQEMERLAQVISKARQNVE